LNLIRVMPAKGQDILTMSTSSFLAKLIGPLFLVVGIAGLVNQGAFQVVAEEALRSHALIYLSGILAMVAGVAMVLVHNVWTADWRVIITVLGWLTAIGGALRIAWPQLTVAAGDSFVTHPASLIIAALIWLAVGAVLTFYGYFHQTSALRTGATG
jgi:uncharacterized membrane protein